MNGCCLHLRGGSHTHRAYAGALAQVRTDDLAADPLTALRDKFEKSNWETVDEVILGCVNQAGEDNRNVARMASLIAAFLTRFLR